MSNHKIFCGQTLGYKINGQLPRDVRKVSGNKACKFRDLSGTDHMGTYLIDEDNKTRYYGVDNFRFSDIISMSLITED